MFYFTIFFGLTILGIILLQNYYKRKFSYWAVRNLNYILPSIPFGNFSNPFFNRQNIGISIANLYNQMKANGWKDGGMYILTRPVYLAIDPDYIKHILTKDFQYFVERGIVVSEDEPLTNNLLLIGGEKWRNLRTKLTPTFTSGKIKGMFPIFLECGQNLSRAMSKYVKQNSSINIKEVLGCFTTDIIGSCAFGLECGSFEDINSPFRINAKKFFTATPFLTFSRVVFVNAPKLAKILGLKFVPKDCAKFFENIVKETEAYRRENQIKRNDFFQLLIDLMNDNQLTMDEVIAQAFLFFVAGYETSSSAMTFTLYELAKHKEIQEKVRKEIEIVLKKNGNIITYDSLKEMIYLQQVMDEAMRKYPPVPFITRKCVKHYQHPYKKDFVIEEGTRVYIPIFGIHRDHEHYPEPERFDPERFNEKNKQKRHQYAYLPFGEGPRMCLGLRFGLLQMKIGLVTLLKDYQFDVNERTQEPITFGNNSMVLTAKGDIWLDVKLN